MTLMNEIFPLYANKQVMRILGKLQKALPAKFNRLHGILIGAITQRPERENSTVLFVFSAKIKARYLLSISGKNSMSVKTLSNVLKVKVLENHATLENLKFL